MLSGKRTASRRRRAHTLLASVGAFALVLVFAEPRATAAESEGDSATIVVDGQAVTLDAALVQQVAAALNEHGNDAVALEQAIAEIVQANASGAQNQALAKAILGLAVSMSSQEADTIAAIVAGVQAGNGSISAGDLLAALPAEGDSSDGADSSDDGGSSEGEDESTASSDADSTASESLAASENAQQVSPVTM